MLLLGMALTEALGIFALVIAFVILFARKTGSVTMAAEAETGGPRDPRGRGKPLDTESRRSAAVPV